MLWSITQASHGSQRGCNNHYWVFASLLLLWELSNVCFLHHKNFGKWWWIIDNGGNVWVAKEQHIRNSNGTPWTCSRVAAPLWFQTRDRSNQSIKVFLCIFIPAFPTTFSLVCPKPTHSCRSLFSISKAIEAFLFETSLQQNYLHNFQSFLRLNSPC